MLKKAMIMSAGIGTRLEPLTLSVPKPLIPLANIPVMDFSLVNLSNNGIKDVIANLYYLADKIEQRYSNKNLYGVNFNFIKEDVLSGTAGGVKKCQFFFDENEDFLVLSGDGLTDFEINEAYSSHKNSGAIATMVVKEIDKSETHKYGVVLTDEKGFVSKFQEKPKTEEALSTLINTGIYIFKYDIFNFIPENTFYDFAKNVFPSILEQGLKINTFTTKRYWNDIGSLNQYMQSNKGVLNSKLTLSKDLLGDIEKIGYISESDVSNVTIEGNCSIGKNCVFGENVRIENSILWNNIVVGSNVIIRNSIIASNNEIKQDTNNLVIGSEAIKQAQVVL